MTTIHMTCERCGGFLDHCPTCYGTGCTLRACHEAEYCDFSGADPVEASAHAPRCPTCADGQWWCRVCTPNPAPAPPRTPSPYHDRPDPTPKEPT